MNYIKKKIEKIKNDKVLIISLALSGLLLLIYSYFVFKNGYKLEPVIRIVFYASLFPIIFFAGRQGLFWAYLLFAYIITLFIRFDNFSPFIIICLFCLIKTGKDHKKNMSLHVPVLTTYFICVFIVCQLHEKTAFHLIIHSINCFLIYFFAYRFVKNNRPCKPLVLDDMQYKILLDLSTGKMQKELDYVSKNTIKAKIDDAIVKNNLVSKEHLMTKFINQYIES